MGNELIDYCSASRPPSVSINPLLFRVAMYSGNPNGHARRSTRSRLHLMKVSLSEPRFVKPAFSATGPLRSGRRHEPRVLMLTVSSYDSTFRLLRRDHRPTSTTRRLTIPTPRSERLGIRFRPVWLFPSLRTSPSGDGSNERTTSLTGRSLIAAATSPRSRSRVTGCGHKKVLPHDS
jgi:hypothetical protein